MEKTKLLYHNKRLGTKIFHVIYNGKVYAVKSFPKSLAMLYKNEIMINKQLKHIHILPYHYAQSTSTRVYMYFDYAVKGDLFELIHNHEETSIEYKVSKIIKPLISAVSYLHIHDLVHMDIKPENVFMGEDYYLYLADFGLSIDLNRLDDYKKMVIGTRAYAAPEQLLGQVVEYKKIDIWCIGLLLYELFHKKLPFTFKEHLPFEKVFSIYESTVFATTHNKRLDLLIYRMLQFDPIDRIDIEGAKRILGF